MRERRPLLPAEPALRPGRGRVHPQRALHGGECAQSIPSHQILRIKNETWPPSTHRVWSAVPRATATEASLCRDTSTGGLVDGVSRIEVHALLALIMLLFLISLDSRRQLRRGRSLLPVLALPPGLLRAGAGLIRMYNIPNAKKYHKLTQDTKKKK